MTHSAKWFLLVLLAFLIFAGTARAQTTCDMHTPSDPPTDEDALIALYCATDGPNWTNSTNWLTAQPLGSWHGVTTGANGRVNRVALPENNLVGTIPPQLGGLTSLRGLVLHTNELTGSIPAELGNLKILDGLALHENELTGSIPAELGDLKQLTFIYLHTNELTGSIPAELGDLTNLQFLLLYTNELTGSIPAELGDLTNLQWLFLNENELTGSIPAELGDLQQLIYLYLNENELTGSIPAELGDMTNLQHLILHTNELTGSIPAAELKRLTMLTYLYLHTNELTGSIPAELGDMTNLQHLVLHKNQLSGEIPDLSRLTSLQQLSLYDNQSTDGERLHGYPNILNTRSGLYLFAPGTGAPVCLPSTADGTDCLVPTKVDKLHLRPSSTQIVLTWEPHPADPTPSGYSAQYRSAATSWVWTPTSPAMPQNPTITFSGLTHGETYQVRVRTDDSSFPWLWAQVTLPPQQTQTLTVDASPPCGSTVTDTSVPLTYTLVLTPAPDTETPIERRVAADNYTEWLSALPIETSGRSTRNTGNSFPQLRNAFEGFRGFEFRLTDTPAVTAECTWTFTQDPVPPPPPPPTPTPPTVGGPPPVAPSDPDPPSPRCGETDRQYLERFYKMTDGEGWDRDENWNSPEPLGEWYGVETENGSVVSLRLPDNNLSGDMPTTELLCLKDKELVELALWGNDDLEGEVPPELVLAVERAALRDIAETLNINPEWFESYGDPFDFEDWHTGVTTDDDGRVIELDLPGEVPETIISQFRKLRMITTSSEGGGCALSPKDDSSAFGLFLLTLVVFAVLGRTRARG